MNQNVIFKKRIRINDFTYIGYYRYFITLCANDKQKFFINDVIVKDCIEILKSVAIKFQFKIWAYCFMPDHLHVLIEGISDNSNMKKFLSVYKQKTGFYFMQKYKKRLWQINFYEHVLRKEEDIISVAKYIFYNPVRKKLEDNFKNYPFSGSFEFDIKVM
jgi:putative transposase